MKHIILLVGKKAVRIIDRFDHSVVVEFIKTGVKSSINPKYIKRKVIDYNKKDKPKPKQLKMKFK